MPYQVTLFPDYFASKKSDRELKLKHISDPHKWPTKKSMPLITMAKYGDQRTEKGSYKHDANVEEAYGFALDYDNNDGKDYPFEDAMFLIDEAGINARGYTSPSHTEEHPRWRILVPYSTAFTGGIEKMKRCHKGGVKTIEEILDCEFSPESHRISQAYYIGECEQAESYTWASTEGMYIDELHDLPAIGYLYSGNGHDTGHDKLDVGQVMESLELGTDLHENLLKITSHLAKYRFSREYIIKHAQSFMHSCETLDDGGRWQQRYDSIGRLTDGAIRKLEAGEWQYADPTAPSNAKGKDKKKGRVVTLASMTAAYEVTDKDLAEIDATGFIYKEIFRGPQMIAIVGPPSAGKTTVMEHICSEMSATHNIIYVNADISSGDVPAAKARAAAGGYQLWCPDIKKGKDMQSVVDDVTLLTEQGTNCAGSVFVFDTLKKMTDMINKSLAKDLYKMLRKLTAICHATVICMAHTNKYGHDDWPMYEGTADLRSDFDAIGLLYPLKGDYGQITTALYWGADDDLPWGKTRGRVDHAAWSMDTNDEGGRTVDQVKWIDTFELAKDAAATKRMEDVNIAIANAIHGFDGDPNMSDVCRLSGHPMRITRKVLDQGEGKYWTLYVGEHNAKFHVLTDSGRELLELSTAESDFDELLQ